MKGIYKIQAAFVQNKASYSPESREGFHFWRLIQETPSAGSNKTTVKVLSVFEPHLTDQKKHFVPIALWHVASQLNATVPDNTHVVYEDNGKVTAVQARWEVAKQYLSKESNQFCFDHRGPLNPSSKYDMQNFIYHLLAQVMNIKAYSFIESSLFEQKIASQKFMGLPFQIQKSLSFSPSLVPSNETHYKIVAAVNHNFLKSGPMLVLNKRKLNQDASFVRTAHHFWMLTVNYGLQDTVFEVMQGLPTQITKRGIGKTTSNFSLNTRNALLKIHALSPKQDHQNWIIPEKTKVAYEGKDVLSVWQQMKAFIPFLNNEQVPYSFLGLGMSMLFGGRASNGNSAYATIGFILEQLIESNCKAEQRMRVNFEVPHFEGFVAPGIRNPMASQKVIRDHFNTLVADPTDSIPTMKIF